LSSPKIDPEACSERGAAAHELLPFERLLAALSAGFVNLPAARVDGAITDALRDEATWRRVGVRSNRTMPLVVGGEIEGALALAALGRERAWPEPLMSRIRVLADVARLFGRDRLLAGRGRRRTRRSRARDARLQRACGGVPRVPRHRPLADGHPALARGGGARWSRCSS